MAVLSRRLCAPLLSASLAFQSTTSTAFSLQFLSRRPATTFISSARQEHRHCNYFSSTALKMSSDGDIKPKNKPIVQYIVLRRDLDWPKGAMAAQAAHASVAAVAQALEAQSDEAKRYISPENLPHMTKYVYGVDNLEELEQVKQKWNDQFSIEEKPTSYWWVEQPENIPTAFATWPVERTNKVSKVVKNMKLDFF